MSTKSRGSDIVSDFPEFGKIDNAWICTGTGDDHFRLGAAGDCSDLVVIDDTVALGDLVGFSVIGFTGDILEHAVGQVATVGQVHAEDGIARFQHREIDCSVRLGAGMRLDIDVISAEQLFGAFDRQILGDVDIFAAAIITLARITFGVFVGQAASQQLREQLR